MALTLPAAREIRVTGSMIRLGQLLKLGGVAGSGADSKGLLAAEAVLVNGAVETRRERQLHDGDVVEVGEWEFRISAARGSRLTIDSLSVYHEISL